jgi:hypothetical protein
MAKKQTSASVSKLAARVLSTDNPLEAHRTAIADAFRACGLPLSDRAVTALTDRIGDALAPLFADMRTLAASALSQDETPKSSNGGPIKIETAETD